MCYFKLPVILSTSQLTFTCPKSTIETIERSVLIVNLERILHLFLVFLLLSLSKKMLPGLPLCNYKNPNIEIAFIPCTIMICDLFSSKYCLPSVKKPIFILFYKTKGNIISQRRYRKILLAYCFSLSMELKLPKFIQ